MVLRTEQLPLGDQTHRGPEGRPLNVSPARKGWVGIRGEPAHPRFRRGSAIGAALQSAAHRWDDSKLPKDSTLGPLKRLIRKTQFSR
jgi:hypothetical protein